MKACVVGFILLLSVPSFADDSQRKFEIFAGAGLSVAQDGYSVPYSGSTRFLSQGFLAEGGISLPFGNSFGFQPSIEIGQNSASNSSSSSNSLTSVEVGTASYYAIKAGFFSGPVTVGGGYRQTDLSLKSISTVGGTTTLQSSYSGGVPFGFVNLSYDINRRYRTVVEAQYVDGDLTSGTPGAASTIHESEMAISLRFFIVFD